MRELTDSERLEIAVNLLSGRELNAYILECEHQEQSDLVIDAETESEVN